MVSCQACGRSKSKDDAENRITWHRFPTDPKRFQSWLKLVDNPEEFTGLHMYLCSLHFMPECFDDTSLIRKRLKGDAVPTIKMNYGKSGNEENDYNEEIEYLEDVHVKRELENGINDIEYINVDDSDVKTEYIHDAYNYNWISGAHANDEDEETPATSTKRKKKKQAQDDESERTMSPRPIKRKTKQPWDDEDEGTASSITKKIKQNLDYDDNDKYEISADANRIKLNQTVDVQTPICSVEGCTSSSPDESVDFFEFPQSKRLLKAWIEFTGKQSLNINKALICSLHFPETEFITEIQETPSGLTLIRDLNEDAVPTIQPPTSTIPTSPKVPEPYEFEYPDESIEVESEENEVMEDSDRGDISKKIKQYIKLKAVNKILERKLEKLQEDELEITRYIDKQKEVAANFSKIKNTKKPFTTKILSKVFSEAQIKLLSGLKRVTWSDDDYATAFTIRYLSSRRFYRHLTETLKYPLPGIKLIYVPRKPVGEGKKVE